MIFSLIDTETTDLTKHPDVHFRHQPRMVEFAGILTDGKDILDEVEFMVNPMRPISPDASKVSGITDEDVGSFEPFGDGHLKQLRDHFRRAQVVIAHNLSFDRQIVNTEMLHQGMNLNAINWPKIEICTIEETSPLFGKPMKLVSLYDICTDGAYKQKHRARDDLNLLHTICQRYGIYAALQLRFAA